MSVTTIAVTSARAVRTTALVVAAVLIVGVLALQAFSSQYGQRPPIDVVDVGEINPALSTAVLEQEAAGLRCSSQPALTDVVLFQQARGGQVIVMTFDGALAATQARAGWVRSYCL